MAWSNLKATAVPREWVEAIASVLEGKPAPRGVGRAGCRDARALPHRQGKGWRPAGTARPNRFHGSNLPNYGWRLLPPYRVG